MIYFQITVHNWCRHFGIMTAAYEHYVTFLGGSDDK